MADSFHAAVSTVDLDSVYPEVRRRLVAWAGWQGLEEVMAKCSQLKVFLAGGVIRNCILDPMLPVKDFDFFLGGASLSEAVEVLSGRGAISRTPFNAPRWHPTDTPECYADLIPIVEFQAGLWKCEDIVDVLNQFDFTASAIAFDLRNGKSFNPQNGLRDIARRTMRMVRFDFPKEPYRPGARLTKTAILWFRILHYAAALGLAIEPLTMRWLQDHRAYQSLAADFCAEFFPLHDRYLASL